MFLNLLEVILGPGTIFPSSLKMLPLVPSCLPSASEMPFAPSMSSDLFLNVAFIYPSGLMPGSYCFEDVSFMGHFNPGLCLESLVPLSPKLGRAERLGNGQGVEYCGPGLWPSRGLGGGGSQGTSGRYFVVNRRLQSHLKCLLGGMLCSEHSALPLRLCS